MPEPLGRRRVVEAGAARCDIGGAVGVVDTTTGKDHHAGPEGGLRVAPEHEHLDAR